MNPDRVFLLLEGCAVLLWLCALVMGFMAGYAKGRLDEFRHWRRGLTGK